MMDPGFSRQLYGWSGVGGEGEAQNAYSDSKNQEDLSPMSQRLEVFDTTIKDVTKTRGEAYGHPASNFKRIDELKKIVADCKDPLARHALEMICVKVARLIETPTHLDSWIDIAGYARTGVMVTDKENK